MPNIYKKQSHLFPISCVFSLLNSTSLHFHGLPVKPFISGFSPVTGKVSTKVDVYAFGVILMELIARRKVLDESLGEEDCNLVVAFRRYFIQREKFRNFIDPSLVLDEKAYESVLQVSELACHCTAREANQRPTMGYAVQVLSPLVDQWVPVASSSNYQDEVSGKSLSQELAKWQSDTDSNTFSTFRGSPSTRHY